MSSASRMASIAATPIPLSEPSVVPSAVRYSPSITGRIASLSKSNSVPLFFSWTMSRCDWSTIVGALSRPGVPGLRTTTFPTSSTWWSSPAFSAIARTWARACSSFFEPRGMVRIVSK